MLFIPLFNKLYAVFYVIFAQDFVISQQIFEIKYNINKNKDEKVHRFMRRSVPRIGFYKL